MPLPMINSRRRDRYLTPPRDEYQLPSHDWYQAHSQKEYQPRVRRVGDAGAAHQQRQRAKRYARVGALREDHHEYSTLTDERSRSTGPADGEEEFWRPNRQYKRSPTVSESGKGPARFASSANKTDSVISAASEGNTESKGYAAPGVIKEACSQSLREESAGHKPDIASPARAVSTIHDLYCINGVNTQKTLSTSRWNGPIERARNLFNKRRDAFVAAKNTLEEKKKKEDRDHARTLFHRLVAFQRAELNLSKASAQANQTTGIAQCEVRMSLPQKFQTKWEAAELAAPQWKKTVIHALSFTHIVIQNHAEGQEQRAETRTKNRLRLRMGVGSCSKSWRDKYIIREPVRAGRAKQAWDSAVNKSNNTCGGPRLSREEVTYHLSK
ncbi:MAG: hypothetical protein L6R42_004741 [Xanthoria sp. 1 TBL-2021]|nr:MAG: hypothetical protein L6R42_004741 [Xanthoria sp. 1 TBL-2021]